jgi:hypothetical protein
MEYGSSSGNGGEVVNERSGLTTAYPGHRHGLPRVKRFPSDWEGLVIKTDSGALQKAPCN